MSEKSEKINELRGRIASLTDIEGGSRRSYHEMSARAVGLRAIARKQKMIAATRKSDMLAALHARAAKLQLDHAVAAEMTASHLLKQADEYAGWLKSARAELAALGETESDIPAIDMPWVTEKDVKFALRNVAKTYGGVEGKQAAQNILRDHGEGARSLKTLQPHRYFQVFNAAMNII